jgi:hypothetical protein
MTNRNNAAYKLRRNIKGAIIIVILGLLLNGISAIPLRSELNFLLSNPDALPDLLRNWWIYVNKGLTETSGHYPFMRYGFDWLAFAHLLIAIAFIGPLRDPIKNEWVITWGIIASVLSVVMALSWERLREIPLWWSSIDAVIGLISFIILLLCSRWIKKLKASTNQAGFTGNYTSTV